jgi:hypothetical protein
VAQMRRFWYRGEHFGQILPFFLRIQWGKLHFVLNSTCAIVDND